MAVLRTAAVRLRSTPVGAEQMSTGHFAPSRSVFDFIGPKFPMKSKIPGTSPRYHSQIFFNT